MRKWKINYPLINNFYYVWIPLIDPRVVNSLLSHITNINSLLSHITNMLISYISVISFFFQTWQPYLNNFLKDFLGYSLYRLANRLSHQFFNTNSWILFWSIFFFHFTFSIFHFAKCWDGGSCANSYPVDRNCLLCRSFDFFFLIVKS